MEFPLPLQPGKGQPALDRTGAEGGYVLNKGRWNDVLVMFGVMLAEAGPGP
jgi:hypothetical protein